MKRMKKLYEYALVCMVVVGLVTSFGCACWKKGQDDLATVEVATPAPPVETAPMPAPVVEGALEKQAREEGALQTIYFDFDMFNIQPSAAAKLDITGGWLKKHPEAALVIEGNCDERGTNEYNMALGERRAASAQQYLLNLGVAPSQISTMSYGEEQPVDPGHTEAAWAKNRRDDFKLAN